MKSWNERRLEDFYRLNFNPKYCTAILERQRLTVTDQNNESLSFVIRDNRIYCIETQKYYQ